MKFYFLMLAVCFTFINAHAEGKMTGNLHCTADIESGAGLGTYPNFPVEITDYSGVDDEFADSSSSSLDIRFPFFGAEESTLESPIYVGPSVSDQRDSGSLVRYEAFQPDAFDSYSYTFSLNSISKGVYRYELVYDSSAFAESKLLAKGNLYCTKD